MKIKSTTASIRTVLVINHNASTTDCDDCAYQSKYGGSRNTRPLQHIIPSTLRQTFNKI